MNQASCSKTARPEIGMMPPDRTSWAMMETTRTGMTCSEEETIAETASPRSPETKATAQQQKASSSPGHPSRMTASEGPLLRARAMPSISAV